MGTSTRHRIDREWNNMQREIQQETLKGKPLVQEGIIEFCKNKLDFTPTAYQERFLLDARQFVVARWARQTGKSLTIAALALHHALSKGGRRVVILAPSLRQSKKILQRIAFFIPRIGSWVLVGRVLKTKLEFANGSTIEALPNSSDTIRGDTTSMIIIDEIGYVQADKELYDASVYSLSTTNGRFIASSTPGSRDSLFYAMCTDDDLYGQFSRHHVNYRDALEPNGPLKKGIVESLQQQMREDPWRWQREMEAEFSEDEEAFFPLSLISRCVSEILNTYDDSVVLTGPLPPTGSFYVGCDLGKKIDPSAVAVVEKREGHVYLVHLKRFKLGTEYAHITGYLNRLNQRLRTVRRINIDQTGVGDVFVEQAVKSGLKNALGIMLSLPVKQEIMVYLRQLMEEGRLHLPYDPELINEMNAERALFTKTGQTQFSHPTGTHDDRLWALALAVYASRVEVPEYHPVALTGRIIKPLWFQGTPGWGSPGYGYSSPAYRTASETGSQGKPEASVVYREICIRCGKPKSPVKECSCEE